MLSYICDELLDDIFKRLPSKSLLRFRSVSKSWSNRISSPDFVLKQTALQSASNCENILVRHLKSSKNYYTLHYQSPINSRFKYNSTQPLEFPKGFFVGSCNGIICLRHISSDNVSLWNPSIRRKLTLPYHDSFKNHPEILGFGFGFDSNTNDYKIVRLFYVGEQFKSWVYSLKKRVWCEITPPSTHITRFKSPGCSVNGVLHWVVTSDVLKAFILTFDLSTHVFSEMTLPEEYNQYTKQRPIIYNGSLGMLVSTVFDYHRVWVMMKEYNNVTSWYMTLNLGKRPYEEGVDAVLQLKNGNLLIRNYKFVLDVYPKGGVCSKVCVRYSPKIVILDMVMYVESLALLDIGTVCG